MAIIFGGLSNFLKTTRARFLEALHSKSDGEAAKWTIAMGNEAADLDSIASAIAYSYFASTFLNRPTIALIRASRDDFHLRQENLYAFGLAGLLSNHSDILCINDATPEQLSAFSFVLVDHNQLSKEFYRPDGTCPEVTGIIDHHKDDGYHGRADPRKITIAGSCASLVTHHFRSIWEETSSSVPRELATLLLGAIFIDTGGLVCGGEVQLVDHKAATFLLPHSTFTEHNVYTPEVQEVIRQLRVRKADVSSLSSRDLLRRDYKEYTFKPISSDKGTVVGITSVPLSFESWLEEIEPSPTFGDSMDTWMIEEGRKPDILGVLTSYLSPSGQHKRQQVWLVKEGNDSLRKKLWEGLKANGDLKLEQKYLNDEQITPQGMKLDAEKNLVTNKQAVGRFWQQGDAELTRKYIAPLVKRIIES